MSETSAKKTLLECTGFSVAAETYLTRDYSIDSLEEIAYWDGESDVDTTIKGVTSPGGTLTVGSRTAAVTSRNNGIPVSIRDVANLRLCIYYLRHMERVQRKPVLAFIDPELVRSSRDRPRH
jgi:hypothetical protein